MIVCVITTAAGPVRRSVVNDRASSSQSHAGFMQPVESQSSSVQSRRPTSEPITKPSHHHHHSQQHHIFARLKVASDEAVHVKKPKSGIETFTTATDLSALHLSS